MLCLIQAPLLLGMPLYFRTVLPLIVIVAKFCYLQLLVNLALLVLLQTDAPYSAVYRPADSLDALVKGNGTLAGKGGSKGVWTLSVVDAREGDR